MLIPGCSYSYKNHAGQLKTPEDTHRAMQECGCRRCQNAIGEPELGPSPIEAKVRVVPPEELDISDLRARSYIPKKPSAEIELIELKAKLAAYPPVEAHVLKGYFEYAFEDIDGYEDLTAHEKMRLTPEAFRAIHNWVFGVKEKSDVDGL